MSIAKNSYVCHALLPNSRKANAFKKALSEFFPEPISKVNVSSVIEEKQVLVTFSVISDDQLDLALIKKFEFKFSGKNQLIFSQASNSPLFVYSVLGPHNYTLTDRFSSRPQNDSLNAKVALKLTGLEYNFSSTVQYMSICVVSPNPIRQEDKNLIKKLLNDSKVQSAAFFEVN